MVSVAGRGSSSDRDEWHRSCAVEQFNATWELVDKHDRSDDDDHSMILAAMTSRWHWGQIGGPKEMATGDWLISHVLCLLQQGRLALLFARRNLDTADSKGWEGWRLASAHEGMARACAVVGDPARRAEHVAAAQAALATETSADDRQAIADQLATIPITDSKIV